MSFVADDEAPELVDPGEGALDDPAVSAEMLASLDAAESDAGRDPASAEVLAAALEVVAFVGVELFEPFSGPASSLADGVDLVDCRRRAMLSCRWRPSG